MGKWVILEIDVEGTLSILERYPQAVTIFVEPSDPVHLEERLRGRGTESPEAIQRRLEVAHRELRQSGHYRHRVVNDLVEDALANIKKILTEAGFSKRLNRTSFCLNNQTVKSASQKAILI
jgi:guanylate kinase